MNLENTISSRASYGDIDRRGWVLVRKYIAGKSDEVFHELVEKYIGLVYSTCLRDLGDRDLAEDAVQATFFIFSQKAGTIRDNYRISLWLYNTARLVCKNILRIERRRRKMEAQVMDSLDNPTQSDALDTIVSHLNEGLDSLSWRDREAILMRFYEDMPFSEIAISMNISEDAARMRTTRAVDRLRSYFQRHHIAAAITSVSLVVFLSDKAFSLAPSADLILSVRPVIDPSSITAYYVKGTLSAMKTIVVLKAASVTTITLVAALSIGAGIKQIYAKPMIHKKTDIAAGSTDKVLLRYKFTPGQTFDYETTQYNEDLKTSTKTVSRVYIKSYDSTADKAVIITSYPGTNRTSTTLTRSTLGEDKSGGIPIDKGGTLPMYIFPKDPIATGYTWVSKEQIDGGGQPKKMITYSLQQTLKGIEVINGHRIAKLHVTLMTNVPGTIKPSPQPPTMNCDRDFDVDMGTEIKSTLSTPALNHMRTSTKLINVSH